jgi:hypothetical protein
MEWLVEYPVEPCIVQCTVSALQESTESHRGVGFACSRLLLIIPVPFGKFKIIRGVTSC